MPRRTTTVSIFLASPDDVRHERELIVQTVGDWNDLGGKQKGMYFDILRWERSVSAGFGKDGQDVVNSQIGDDFDVLIAVFWSRLGSATPRAQSGSVEEYDRALQRFKNAEPLEIAFYFKDAPIDRKSIDPQQISGINKLQNRLQEDGAFYKEFKDDDGLRFEINLLLDRLSHKYSDQADHNIGLSDHVARSNALQVENPAKINATPVAAPALDPDDIGLIDVTEAIQTHTLSAATFLGELNDRLVSLAQDSSEATEVLTSAAKLRPVGPSDMKPEIERVSDSMNKFSEFLENGLAAFSEDTSLISQGIVDLIDMSREFKTEENEIDEFRRALSGLILIMSGTMASLTELHQTTNGLQRMSVKFNKSKRRLSNSLDALIKVLTSSHAVLNQADTELQSIAAQYGNHIR